MILSLRLLLYGVVSSLAAGHTVLHQRLHAFTVGTNTDSSNHYTSLTYVNTGPHEPIVTTFQNSLPSQSLCGDDYERCNALITSTNDGSIHVIVFPLDSGIELVSYNYATSDDTLTYRDQFLLRPNLPNCTFVDFVEDSELIGYCIDLYTHTHSIHAFQIHIDFVDLVNSTIRHRDGTPESTNLLNVSTLTNLVYFVRHSLHDGCFPDDGNHVLLVDEGWLLDHGLRGGGISFSSKYTDGACSRLYRVGDLCELAAHCEGREVLFDTSPDTQPMSFMEAEYGQTFFCSHDDFVTLKNQTLTLHRQQLEVHNISFPFGKISRGYCLKVDDKIFFIGSVQDGRTIKVDFKDPSCRFLGDGDASMTVPVKVKDHIAVTNNGSETDIYNLDLSCAPKPLVVPSNFVLFAVFFSRRTQDQYQCSESSAMVDNLPTTSPAATSNLTTTDLSEPGMSSQANYPAIIPSIVILIIIIAMIVLLVVGLGCYRRRKMSNSVQLTRLSNSDDTMLQELHVEGRESSTLNGGEELLERQHSSDSQTTEVQSNGLMPERTSASSEGTDTCPPSADDHTHTLVLNEPVHQEVGDRESSNKESGPEVGVGDSNGANLSDPSQTDDSDCVHPTPEISNAYSQLCMGNSPTLQGDQPPTTIALNPFSTDNHVTDGMSCSYSEPQATPVEDTGTSGNRFMVGGDTQAGASGSTPCPLPSDVEMKYRQTDDKFNSVQFRQRTAEVGGGTPWNENSTTTINQ